MSGSGSDPIGPWVDAPPHARVPDSMPLPSRGLLDAMALASVGVKRLMGEEATEPFAARARC